MFLPQEMLSILMCDTGALMCYKEYSFFRWYHYRIKPPEDWQLEFLIEEAAWDRCHTVNYDRMYLGI